jgi:hypothetical protein
MPPPRIKEVLRSFDDNGIIKFAISPAENREKVNDRFSPLLTIMVFGENAYSVTVCSSARFEKRNPKPRPTLKFIIRSVVPKFSS